MRGSGSGVWVCRRGSNIVSTAHG